jgi:uncharacterized membrane protein
MKVGDDEHEVVGMHRLAWVAQIALGVFFVVIGVLHFVVPDGLPEPMEWMYDLSTTLHYISGTAEILGGLGLILPAVTGIRPQLVPLAAVGLAVVMVLGALWHLPRDEMQNVGSTLVTAVILLWLAYVRWRVHPLPVRGAAARPREGSRA